MNTWRLLLLSVLLGVDASASELICPLNGAKFLVSYQLKPAPTHYTSSCYLEAYTGLLETLVSSQLYRKVGVSRVAMYAYQWQRRGLEYIKNPKTLEPQFNRRGRANVIAAGSVEDIVVVANDYGVVYVPPKTQLDMYNENKVIRELNEAYQGLLYQYKRDLREQGQEMRFYLTRIYREKIQHLTRHYLMHPIVIENELKDFIPPIFRFTFGGRQFTKVGTATGEKLSPKIEQWLRHEIESGREVALSYYHLLDYGHNTPDSHALLTLPAGKTPIELTEEVKAHSSHAAIIVDVYPKEGPIEYFIVRNSWGQQRGMYKGHLVITMGYALLYARGLYTVEILSAGPFI